MVNAYYQGDIVKVQGLSPLFVIVSKTAMIRALGRVLVCPLLPSLEEGPLHLPLTGEKGSSGVLACEQIKLIDPRLRYCRRVDRLTLGDTLEIASAMCAMFEYI